MKRQRVGPRKSSGERNILFFAVGFLFILIGRNLVRGCSQGGAGGGERTKKGGFSRIWDDWLR